MSYDNHTVAGSLRVNYEKFLYPYEIFLVSNGQLKVHAHSHNELINILIIH